MRDCARCGMPLANTQECPCPPLVKCGSCDGEEWRDELTPLCSECKGTGWVQARQPNMLTFGLVVLLLIMAAGLGVVWPLLLIVGAGQMDYFLKGK